MSSLTGLLPSVVLEQHSDLQDSKESMGEEEVLKLEGTFRQDCACPGPTLRTRQDGEHL